jgi:histidyl-tRNA synthetase
MKILRGMRDLSENNAKKMEHFLNIAIKHARNMGFELIQTPLLELSELFTRGVGSSSDIVSKEMYSFIDKGDNKVSLRPEGTASVVRSYLENKFDKQKQIKKYYYYGAMFRYERPQKGRFRQFNQFGCESFGVESVYEDASLIILCSKIFKDLKIDNILEINSLGCEECMPQYKENLKKQWSQYEDDFCKDCHHRINTNPMRIFDCKNKKCNETSKNFSFISDNLCECCKNDFVKLQTILKENNINFIINKNLVRGLDYYSKTAFEFISNAIGSQSAIAGGGRYDKLINILKGDSVGAIGFAMGIDRILDLILIENKREGIYFGSLDEKYIDKLYSLSIEKSDTSKVFIEYNAKKLQKHLKLADKRNARYCAILGEYEMNKNSIWVKDLENKNEEIISLSNFIKK